MSAALCVSTYGPVVSCRCVLSACHCLFVLAPGRLPFSSGPLADPPRRTSLWVDMDVVVIRRVYVGI